MQLFDILNSQLFKPLSGRNQWIFADLLMLTWDHCRTSTDYGMGKNEMIRLAEDYLEGIGSEAAELNSDEQADGDDQPSGRDLHSKAVWCVARLRNCGWLEDLEIGYEEDARTAICPQVVPILQAFYSIIHLSLFEQNTQSEIVGDAEEASWEVCHSTRDSYGKVLYGYAGADCSEKRYRIWTGQGHKTPGRCVVGIGKC